MTDRGPLAAVLARLLSRRDYPLSRLASDARVSKSVLHRWLRGESRRPQEWRPLMRVAAALDQPVYGGVAGGPEQLVRLRLGEVERRGDPHERPPLLGPPATPP